MVDTKRSGMLEKVVYSAKTYKNLDLTKTNCPVQNRGKRNEWTKNAYVTRIKCNYSRLKEFTYARNII